jgi:hypothetical protein
MTLNCSAGILIWKDKDKDVEPAVADPHPGETLKADCLSAHFTLLAPQEHSKLGVTHGADLSLLYASLCTFS